MVVAVACACAVLLAAALVLAVELESLGGKPRSPWLSFTGGVALAYVFLKLMPELVHAQQSVSEHPFLTHWLREHLLFLTALVGALLVFAIERAAKSTKHPRPVEEGQERSASWVFALHLPVMAVYTALIGYLLFREGKQTVPAVAVLGAVMFVHFGGITIALSEDYRSLHRRYGRFVLAASLLVGAAVGWATPIPDLSFHLLLSVLAGLVIFNVIKEEIPPEKQSRFWAVGLGIVVSAAVIWLAGGA